MDTRVVPQSSGSAAALSGVEKTELQVAWPVVPVPPDAQKDLDLERIETNKESLATTALDDEGMSLECSVWDVALLIGLSHEDARLLTSFQTVVTVVLVLCNITMQLFVTVAVKSTMAPADFDAGTEKAVLTTRLFTNHRYSALDFSEVETRTHQLCKGKVLNMMETTNSDIKSYLSAYAFGTEGVVVAFIAMTIWILSMCTELRRVGELFGSLILLPQTKCGSKHFGKTGLNVSFYAEEDVYMIRKVSLWHKLWYAAVLLVRFVVSLLLMIFGLEWLAGTIVVENLILNACALEIVKSVDEFIFEAAFGYDVRLLVENTRIAHQPIRKMGSLMVKNIELISYESLALCFRLGMVGFWIILGYENYLKKAKNKAHYMRQLLCEKDIDFVWENHPVISLPFFAPTHQGSNESSRVIEELQCSFAASYDMLRLRAGFGAAYFTPSKTLQKQFSSDGEACAAAMCPERSLTQITDLQGISSDEFYETPSECQDYNVHMQVLHNTCMNETYRHLVPWFQERRLCSDFSAICSCPGMETTTTTTTEGMDMPGMQAPQNQQSQQDTARAILSSCVMSNFTDIMTKYDISYEWILTLQRYCPRSCNRCIDPEPPKEPAQPVQMGGQMGGQMSGQNAGSMDGSGNNNSQMSGNAGPQQQSGGAGGAGAAGQTGGGSGGAAGGGFGGIGAGGGGGGMGGGGKTVDLANETDDNATESDTAGRCVCTWKTGSDTSQGGTSQGSTTSTTTAQGSGMLGSDTQTSTTTSQGSGAQGSGAQGSPPNPGGRRLTARLTHQLARMVRQSRKTNAAWRKDRRELLEEQRLLQERNLQLEARLSSLEQQMLLLGG